MHSEHCDQDLRRAARWLERRAMADEDRGAGKPSDCAGAAAMNVATVRAQRLRAGDHGPQRLQHKWYCLHALAQSLLGDGHSHAYSDPEPTPSPRPRLCSH